MDKTKKALVLLADGCEEIEAVTAIDMLRRGGVETVAASASDRGGVAGSHGIRIGTDRDLPDGVAKAREFAAGFDAVVIPGGMGGTRALAADARVAAAARDALARGAVVAAVCAGPLVLGAAGLLAGRRYCCYPGVEREMPGGGTFVPGVRTVTDGNLVTGTGPGTAAEFALAVLRALGGPAGEVARAMLLG